MNDADAESIRKRKEAEYKKQLEQYEQQINLEEQVKKNLRQLLEDKAYERLMNVKVVNYQRFMLASQYILQLAQQLQGRKLTEDEVITLLKNLRGDARGKGNITFIRK